MVHFNKINLKLLKKPQTGGVFLLALFIFLMFLALFFFKLIDIVESDALIKTNLNTINTTNNQLENYDEFEKICSNNKNIYQIFSLKSWKDSIEIKQITSQLEEICTKYLVKYKIESTDDLGIKDGYRIINVKMNCILLKNKIFFKLLDDIKNNIQGIILFNKYAIKKIKNKNKNNYKGFIDFDIYYKSIDGIE